MLIIKRQAKHPEMNAAINPQHKDVVLIADATTSPESISSNSKKASPKIGINTIKNENLVTLSFFTPHKSPVAIVVPLRLNPGSTAKACDKPIMIASL